MNVFKSFKNNLSYNDILELDSAFSKCHINYNKSLIFNKTNKIDIDKKLTESYLLCDDNVENIDDIISSFDGTVKNIRKNDRILLWKQFWLEYINSFDKLIENLPDSIVTLYIGRQTIEIGLKYLLLKKMGYVNKSHDLNELCKSFFLEYSINDSYMDNIDSFCKLFCEYTEGGKVEYFRYPEYSNNKYFAGKHLDAEWLSYNFSLIILKLVHFAELDDEL